MSFTHDLLPDELVLASAIKSLNQLRQFSQHDKGKETILVETIRSASAAFTDNQWERILNFAEQ